MLLDPNYQLVSRWLYWSLVGLGISCFSRIFPNGFEALFSLSLIVASLVCLVLRGKEILGNISLVIPSVGNWLGLFVLLCLSLFWSPWDPGLHILFEYRILFAFSILVPVLLVQDLDSRSILRVFWLAGLVGIFSLFLNNVGFFDGALYPLRPRGSHIIGGVVSSAFIVLSLSLWIGGRDEAYRHMYLIAAILASLETLILEQGRTGYIQIVAVWICFFCIVRQAPTRIFYLILGVSALTAAVAFSGEMLGGLTKAYQEAQVWVAGENQNTSVGLRLQWIFWSFSRGLETPFLGVGAGNYLVSIEGAYESGGLKYLTDNLHSEFANIFLMVGITGLILFVGQYLLILWLAIRCGSRESMMLSVGITIVFVLHGIANSTLKDFGEKNLLLAVMPLVLVSLIRLRQGRPEPR